MSDMVFDEFIKEEQAYNASSAWVEIVYSLEILYEPVDKIIIWEGT